MTTVTPTQPNLNQVLGDLLKSHDPILRARGENFRFEERVSQSRYSQYEVQYSPTSGKYEDWLESHMNYLSASVYTDLPDTFLSVNSNAALPSLVLSELGQEQFLIRVESLEYVLNGDTKLSSLTDLENILAVYTQNRQDPCIEVADAKASLHEVCRSLNQNPYAIRPRFAAFADELWEDIENADWPLLLRDRLGLAHLPPIKASGPYPVALMKYKVKDVVAHALKVNATHPLTVPTVLDAEPYEIFYPSPNNLNYGRTLHLADNGDYDRLASEVLHLRINYAPGHVWKVGAITKRADTSPSRISALRSNHLDCLQLLSNREDFGAL